MPGSGLDGPVIGMPLRRAITTLDRAALRAKARAHFGLDPQAPTVLVFGGSQGARSLNEAVSGAAESVALMRRAARIASRTTGGEWLAVYVTRRDGLSGVTAVQLESLRAKTVELGGTFHGVVAADVVQRRVGHLVLDLLAAGLAGRDEIRLHLGLAVDPHAAPDEIDEVEVMTPARPLQVNAAVLDALAGEPLAQAD